MKKKLNRLKRNSPKIFGPPSQKSGPEYKLKKKLKRMFRMNYDGK